MNINKVRLSSDIYGFSVELTDMGVPRLSNWLNKITLYKKVAKVDAIARRYFVMDSFNGAITTMGIIMGSIIAGVVNVNVIATLIISTTLAMSISGFFGTFMAESVERKIEISRLEDALLMKLEGSIYANVIKFASLYLGLIDALSPIIPASMMLLPILLAGMGALKASTSLHISLFLSLLYLFVLGAAFSKYIGRRGIVEGLKFVLIGLFTSLVIYLLLKG